MKLLPTFLTRIPKTAAKKSAPAARARVAPAPTATPLPLPGMLERKLQAFRSRYQQVEIATGLAILVGTASLLLLVQGFVDWWLDLPRLARFILLLADLVAFAVIYHRFLHRSITTRPALNEAALHLEKKWPQLRQSVIAAVELAAGGYGSTRGSPQLVDLMLAEANQKSAPLNFNEVLPTRLLYRCLLGMGAVVLATLVIAVLTRPASLVLAERIFLVDVPLPTRTVVVPVTRDLVVPAGSDVELIARAEGVIPNSGRVTVTGTDGVKDFPVSGATDKPAVFSFTVHNAQSDFHYAFHLNDGHGPEFTVEVRVPPAVSGLACEQVYPDYTGLPTRKLAASDLSLLAGSHLKITAHSTKPLKSASVILTGTKQTEAATLNADGTQIDADLPIPAKDLTGFSVHLVDTASVESVNDTVYSIVVIPDHPPKLKIIEPADSHESITLQAKPVVVFEAGDDYGLSKLTLHYRAGHPPVAGQSTEPPPVKDISIDPKSTTNGRYTQPLDATGQSPAWTEGTTISYWIEAVDNNTATGPGTTKTDPQQLEIVSTETKQAELLDRLKQNAAEIDTLSDTQQKASMSLGETIKK